MPNDNFQDEPTLRRFLLGTLPDAARDALEERFLADEELFTTLRVVEDELIEAYVRGTLPPEERARFERSFLATARRRERVAVTRALLEGWAPAKKAPDQSGVVSADEDNSLWQRFLDFWRGSPLRWATAALVLLAGGALWFWSRPVPPAELPAQTIARATPPAPPPSSASPQPAPTVAATPARPLATPTPHANPTATPAPSSPVPPANQRPVVATLTLLAGATRGPGAQPPLELSAHVTEARLQLALESADYPRYRAAIFDADNNQVWRSGFLRPRAARLLLSVPAAQLKNGDYFLKLEGQPATGAAETVADYSFRVVRR